MLDKLRKLRADHLRIQHDLVFYPYQEEISDRILQALLENLRITANATEEDVKKLKQHEIAIEISRQAGKTLAVGHTAEFILTFLPTMFKRPIRIGVFAGQVDQAKISYNIMRNSLRQAKATLFSLDEEQERYIKEEENARRLVMPDGSSAAIAPISKTSQIEGLTLDLIIIDEAQDADDEIVQHTIWPMGKTTNAPRVYIGKAGTRICHFYRLSQAGNSYKVYFDEVVKQRRETYAITDDARHLIYEQSVRQDITTYGEDSDFIQREYFGRWQIGTGQFTTLEELTSLVEPRGMTYHHKEMECFAGIDTAKHPDSTVVTIIRYNPDKKKKELLNWCELHGENYENQYEIIMDFLSHYRIIAVAIDATGQGDFMPDKFEAHSEWADEHSGLYRVKFSAVSKDNIYKNLKVSIKELLTTLPKLDTKQGRKFQQEMLDLQQEHKGQLLSVHHPDDPQAHDDYCFIADTKILTDKGQVNIQDIGLGDLVMTRNGLKPVIKIGSRYARVITKLGLTGTPDHPFITEEGIKRFESLAIHDKIHVWNERLSSIEVKTITDILTQSVGNLGSIIGGTTNGSNRLLHYIGRFILIPSVLFQRAGLYIIKIITLLTMNPLILSPSPEPNINRNMRVNPDVQRSQEGTSNWRARKQKNGMGVRQGLNGTKDMPLTRYTANQSRVFANSVLNLFSMLGKVVRGIVQSFARQEIDGCKKVYNLQVLDAHEYFANSILVHNCDSWALAEWAYAKYNEDNNLSVIVISGEKERKVDKNEVTGQVENYWPGLDN